MEKKTEKRIKPGLSVGMPVLRECAAGIDIGDTEHYVATLNENGMHEVTKYQAFTCDLRTIVKDLKAKGVTTVAMESTGIYWLSLYLLLEEACIDTWLVNAKHVKNVTGRKKDDSDAIWIQKLHSCGLLQRSFQPDDQQRVLRTYVRQRKNLIAICSDSVRRMQKALELMNIKLHTVISDILGKTGMQIVDAILKGERDPEQLAKFAHYSIKATKEEIVKSLDGFWKKEYLFMLGQAHEEYCFYQKQITACDDLIQEQLLQNVAIIQAGDITGFEEIKKKAY